MTAASSGRMPELKPLDPYFEARWAMFPQHPWNAPGGRGKQPLNAGWQDSWTRRQALEDYIAKGHNVGANIPPGWAVIDVDPRNLPPGVDMKAVGEIVRRELGVDPKTLPLVRTGGGGVHMYLRTPHDRVVPPKLGPGIEFKQGRAGITAPPSRHPDTGREYVWREGSPRLVDAPTASTLQQRKPRETPAGGEPELSPEHLQEMLAQLDPCDYRDYQVWGQLMMSIHHATRGSPAALEVVKGWCARDPEYTDKGEKVEAHWDSYRLDVDNPLTGATFVRLFALAGGKFPEGMDPGFTESAPETLYGVVQSMNGRFAKVLDAQRACVLDLSPHKTVDPSHLDASLHSHWDKHYKGEIGMVAVRNANGKFTAKHITQLWYDSPQARSYDGLIMDPDRPSGDVRDGVRTFYNTWQGFSSFPGPRAIPQTFLHLIHRGMCWGDPAQYEYVMNWMAYLLTHPGRVGEVALVCQGPKGVGKSTLGETLVCLTAPHSKAVKDVHDLFGRFSATLRYVTFVFMDEPGGAALKRHEPQLKTLLTSPTLHLEPKHKEKIVVPNRVSMMLATNDLHAVPASTDERRYAVFEFADDHCGRSVEERHAYFGGLLRELESGGYGWLHDHLMERGRNLGDWRPAIGIPNTRALQAQKVLSAGRPMQWWMAVLHDGMLNGEPLEARERTLDSLYAAFETWCAANDARSSQRYPHSRQGFLGEWMALSPVWKNPGYNAAKQSGVLEPAALQRASFREATGVDLDTVGLPTKLTRNLESDNATKFDPSDVGDIGV